MTWEKMTIDMLVDPIHISAERGGIAAILAAIGGGDPEPKRVQRGLYQISHFSFDHCLPKTVSFPRDVERDDGWWLVYPDLSEVINPGSDLPLCEFGSFGVCDSVEQFLEHKLGKWIVESEKGYVVSFSKIVKANQPDSGGWRWHKWGEYIGVHEPQCEYIYDEGDEIQEVYCYHVYECLKEEAHRPIEENNQSEEY